ncbi:hypothetical protein HanOQP8_Chr12g0435671 [Helianthus annuus]|nr:hypothetical protein HanOQP8_Chr12g0435671 [Helianthus annuus]
MKVCLCERRFCYKIPWLNSKTKNQKSVLWIRKKVRASHRDRRGSDNQQFRNRVGVLLGI